MNRGYVDGVYIKPWQEDIAKTCYNTIREHKKHQVSASRKRKSKVLKTIRYIADSIVIGIAMVIYVAGIWQIATWISILTH